MIVPWLITLCKRKAYSICMKLSLRMMPASGCIVKGAGSRGDRGSSLTTLTPDRPFARSRLPAGQAETDAASGMSPKCSTIKPFSVFGPARGNCVPAAIERSQLRHSVDDDAAVCLAAEVSVAPGACVVNSPMISSTCPRSSRDLAVRRIRRRQPRRWRSPETAAIASIAACPPARNRLAAIAAADARVDLPTVAHVRHS